MTHPSEFRSPAYRALSKDLGESDAAVEWIEVGVRELQRIQEDEGTTAAQELAERHGLCVHPMDLKDLRRRCARLQLLAAFQQVEAFFKSFRKTHPRQVEWRQDRGSDLLSATLSAFGVKIEAAGELEAALFQHYRGVRNMLMHDPQGRQRDSETRRISELRQRVAASPYGGLDAPNGPDDLSFEDFVLFTRASKQLAANLCSATVPTDSELIDWAMSQLGLLKRVRSLLNNRKRAEMLVAGRLRGSFSLPDERARALGGVVLDQVR